MRNLQRLLCPAPSRALHSAGCQPLASDTGPSAAADLGPGRQHEEASARGMCIGSGGAGGVRAESGVIVTQRLMPVQAHVAQARYARQDSGVFSVMLMLVVQVVFVRVFVLQDFLRVPVFMLVAHPYPTGCLRQCARLRRARSR